MVRSRFVCLLVFPLVAAMAAELPAQTAPPESTARERFNQVFVKVIVPVTARTPKQDGPVVESWVAKQLKKQGVSEYFAITDWVPVCDGLLADDVIDNDVWDGRLAGEHVYCPIGGDIPERKNGRVLVQLRGWLPTGVETNIRLADEPGSRAVRPVQRYAGEDPKSGKPDMRLPYVAVLIAPPPYAGLMSHVDGDSVE
ncbi:MAG: hypothetical protein ACE37I_05260 [Rubinisphaera brasiliensis]|uniref:hypothetical protein n=1 Tax=Rubinisphaera brasiliensis TaxID=119 RepID=UPI00391B73DE